MFLRYIMLRKVAIQGTINNIISVLNVMYFYISMSELRIVQCVCFL